MTSPSPTGTPPLIFNTSSITVRWNESNMPTFASPRPHTCTCSQSLLYSLPELAHTQFHIFRLSNHQSTFFSLVPSFFYYHFYFYYFFFWCRVVEGSDATLQCRADGTPMPSISWEKKDTMGFMIAGRFRSEGQKEAVHTPICALNPPANYRSDGFTTRGATKNSSTPTYSSHRNWQTVVWGSGR